MYIVTLLFNLYAEYIMWNVRLDDSQTGIKTTGINTNNLRYSEDNHSNGQKQRGAKEPFDGGERGEWKSWLETQHSKNEDHGIPLCVCSSVSSVMPNSLPPVDCNPAGFSVHGILQARILEWVAMASFRGSAWLRDWTHVSCTSVVGRLLSGEPLGKTPVPLLDDK